jgi:hypothetical protein
MTISAIFPLSREAIFDVPHAIISTPSGADKLSISVPLPYSDSSARAEVT